MNRSLKKRFKKLMCIMVSMALCFGMININHVFADESKIPAKITVSTGYNDSIYNYVSGVDIDIELPEKVGNIYNAAKEKSLIWDYEGVKEVTGWSLWKMNDSGKINWLNYETSDADYVIDKAKYDESYYVSNYGNRLPVLTTNYQYIVPVKRGDGKSIKIVGPSGAATDKLVVPSNSDYKVPSENHCWVFAVTTNEKGVEFYPAYSGFDFVEQIENIQKDLENGNKISEANLIRKIELVDIYGAIIVGTKEENIYGVWEDLYKAKLTNVKYPNYGTDGLSASELNDEYGDLFNDTKYHYEITGWKLWQFNHSGYLDDNHMEIKNAKKLQMSDGYVGLTESSNDRDFIYPILEPLGSKYIEYNISYEAVNDAVSGTSDKFTCELKNSQDKSLSGIGISGAYVYDLYYKSTVDGKYEKQAENITDTDSLWNAYDNLVKSVVDSGSKFVQANAKLVAKTAKKPNLTANSPAQGQYSEDKIVYLECATEGSKIYYYVSHDKDKTISSYDDCDWIEYDSAKGIAVEGVDSEQENPTKIFAYAVATGYDRSDIASFLYGVKLPAAINTIDEVDVEVDAPVAGEKLATVYKLTNELSKDGIDQSNSDMDWISIARDASGIAGYNKVYSVKFTFAAKEGYTFVNSTKAKVNGNDATVEYNEAAKLFTVSYEFAPTRKAKLESVADPKVINVKNGLSLDEIAKMLPKTLAAVVEDASITEGNVEWDLDNFADETTYDADSEEAQTFKLNGKIINITETDYDLNNVSLDKIITINVAAAGEPVEKPDSDDETDEDVDDSDDETGEEVVDDDDETGEEVDDDETGDDADDDDDETVDENISDVDVTPEKDVTTEEKEDSKAPHTGDDIHVQLVFGLLLFTGTGIVVIKRKKDQ